MAAMARLSRGAEARSPAPSPAGAAQQGTEVNQCIKLSVGSSALFLTPSSIVPRGGRGEPPSLTEFAGEHATGPSDVGSVSASAHTPTEEPTSSLMVAAAEGCGDPASSSTSGSAGCRGRNLARALFIGGLTGPTARAIGIASVQRQRPPPAWAGQAAAHVEHARECECGRGRLWPHS